MLKGYISICRNAEGLHGMKKVGNPWFRGLDNRSIAHLEDNVQHVPAAQCGNLLSPISLL